MARDQKGIYEKALAGTATTVPGVQVTYEPPQAPGVMLDTETHSVEECVEQVLVAMEKRSFTVKERPANRISVE
jgi:adenylylsulfate kinase-like enzyme